MHAEFLDICRYCVAGENMVRIVATRAWSEKKAPFGSYFLPLKEDKVNVRSCSRGKDNFYLLVFCHTLNTRP